MDDSYTNSTETWEAEESYPLQLVLMDVLQSLATAVGALTNILMLILLAATPLLRSVSNVLLLQRAIADVFVLIPFSIIIYGRANRDFQFGQALCMATNIFLYVGQVASDVFLMAYTLDGYQASYPQHHTLPYRRKTMRATSTVAWVLAAAVGVASCFFSYTFENYCANSLLFDSSSLLHSFLGISMTFLLPMVVVWTLLSVALPSRPSQTSAESKAMVEGAPNRRLLLGLASSFTVLHGFYHVIFMLFMLLPFQETLFIPLNIASVLLHFSPAINPILAICLSKELWQKVTGLLPSRRSASLPMQDL